MVSIAIINECFQGEASAKLALPTKSQPLQVAPNELHYRMRLQTRGAVGEGEAEKTGNQQVLYK